MNNIDKKYEIIITKKRKATILVPNHLFEKTLDLILIKKSENKKNLDIENIFQFR